MPRGFNQNKVPTKIYFVQTKHSFLGPYTSRPTKVIKDGSYDDYVPTLISFARDANDNYIKE